VTSTADPEAQMTMVLFERAFASRLYVSTRNDPGVGWWGVLLGAAATPPDGAIALDQALGDAALGASFVYAAIPPLIDSADRTAALIAALDAILAPTFSKRAVVWLPSGLVAAISPATARVQSLTVTGGQVRTSTGFDALLTGTPGINAAVNAGATLTVSDDGEALIQTGAALPAVGLNGPQAPRVVQNDSTARLAFTGPTLGCLSFALSIERRSLAANLAWGFQTLVSAAAPSSPQAPPPPVDRGLPFLSTWLPLANGDVPRPTDYVGFTIQVNVVNPNNLLPASPTVFWFTGKNDPGSSEPTTRLASYYRTAFGQAISLIPVGAGVAGAQQAGLVASGGYLKTPLYNGFSFSPTGDFSLELDADPSAPAPPPGVPARLLCGLSGSETIAFLPRIADVQVGSRLRFYGGDPAYAPEFPLADSSPVGPPIDPAALLMTTDYRTSWASVLGAPASDSQAHYAAAPRGADPFGKPSPATVAARGRAGIDCATGAAGDQGGCILEPLDPGVALPDVGLKFPLFPLAGFTAGTGEQDLTGAQLELLDRQILGPTRRSQITRAAPPASASAAASLRLVRGADADAPFNTTTPAGLIARVDGGAWTRLLLAQAMTDGTVTRQLGFTSLVPDLQAAFQTDNLLLVAANARYLGAFAEGVLPDAPPPGGPPGFYNAIHIDQWKFSARVGEGSAYGDYRNVMIVKGVKGKLIDLVNSPEQWTQKDRFAPADDRGEPDVSQLIPLASWLAAYFAAALERADDPYFQDFCRLIQQPTWQGVLFLRVDVAGTPPELLGVLAGVSDPASFNAHHLGVELSQIDCGQIAQADTTSLFGLVNYVDPTYDDSLPPHAVTPDDMSAKYEFTTLVLKALFRNAAVQKFESVAQVVLNELFGSRVAEMGDGGNDFNAVVMQGAYQMNGAAPVYALSAVQPGMFLLANNILLSVDLTTATMSTRDDGAVSGEVVSWIAMAGRMSFAIITADKQPAFDIFSFGPESGRGGEPQGLAFSALGLRMASPAGQVGRALPTLEEQELVFNTSDSQARRYSLFRNFELELRGLISGDLDTAPAGLGYLAVATPYGLQGVQARRWHGLTFRINMGTPGALASKINLSSTLLVAWADDSGAPDAGAGFAAQVGLQLPGAGPAGELFSLQTVIKVSIGVVRLLYNEAQHSFLLLMNEIALKLFGLLKIPPNGATSFFLFGNPAATDPTGLGWYAIYNQDAPKR
jgi:hypothetical protein